MDYVREHTISLYVLQILSSSSTGNTFAYLFRPLCSVATAGFFPLDLGFLVSSGFLGIFVSNLFFFI